MNLFPERAARLAKLEQFSGLGGQYALAIACSQSAGALSGSNRVLKSARFGVSCRERSEHICLLVIRQRASFFSKLNGFSTIAEAVFRRACQ
jgi:hypothetical protein